MTPATDTNQTPVLEGVSEAINVLKLKHAFDRFLFILLLVSGAKGIYDTTHDIFFAYPKLAEYYRQLNFDPSIYAQILRQAALASVASFVESAFGLTMLFRKSTAIKLFHTLAAIAILATSWYLKREGALPDLEAIEHIAFKLFS